MKHTYKATWGGKKALLRDIKPGMSLFVINEHAPITDPRHPGIDAGPGRTYSEWIVTTKRSTLIGDILAQSPTHHGYEAVTSLLAKEREIHTQRPDLPLRGGPEDEIALSASAQRAARKATERHIRDASEGMSRRWALAGR
ncbi:hypothetical protein [Streptomyces nymphaeiformis]|uniref:Uncharacterized protein n=1 Tax=Streptomyces nymphaeiformis TaxID=2663842 RepID=A0A7W7U4U3_9ACTN|nr:hypothetical protein [Streptomyces nymphaeiformis]MBB4985011.1 hypothetical protein [Streptomyces nymphaeiformis]